MNKKLFCFLLLVLLKTTFCFPLKSREQGGQISGQDRPNLIIEITNRKEISRAVFPGARFTLEVLITNTGERPTGLCYLKAEGGAFILTHTTKLDLFSVNPGESTVKRVPVEIRNNAPLGPVKLIIEIEESEGNNMFPDGNLTLYIEEPPDFDLAVVDFAIRDQSGKGFFEQFEDVEVFFRIQNCGNKLLEDVSVSFELLEHTIGRRFNPNRQIGKLAPGEYSDVSGMFSTGLASEGIALNLTVEAGEIAVSQNFQLDFFVDYQEPERLTKDGCQNFIPGLPGSEEAKKDFEYYPALDPADNKFAIIFANQNYDFLEDLTYAGSDALVFMDFLKDHFGFRQEHIFVFFNKSKEQQQEVFEMRGRRYRDMRRALRQRETGKELLFFFIGHAAVDFDYGNIYLLPADYQGNKVADAIRTTLLLDQLAGLKEDFNFYSISAILNLNYKELVRRGSRNENNFLLYHNAPSMLNGVLFSGTSSGQKIAFSDQSQSSYFTDLFVEGLKGRADFSGDGSIMASDLYRFLSDQLSGVPALARQEKNMTQVPLWFGRDRMLADFGQVAGHHQAAVAKTEVGEEDEVLEYAESMPSFPGGEAALAEYLSRNIRYPHSVRQRRLSGTVFISFVVDKDGSLINPEVIRGIGEGCDEEAIRLVRNMPKWEPGMVEGKPVRVRVTLPIQFVY